MDELEPRLRSRLRSLADAVPVAEQPLARVGRPPAGPRARVLRLAAGVAVVVTALATMAILGRGSGPVAAPATPTGPEASAAMTPGASPAPAGRHELRLDVLAEDACPPDGNGACHYTATLTGEDGRARDIPMSGAAVELVPGAYRLTFESRIDSRDEFANGSPLPGAIDATCDGPFRMRDDTWTMVARIVVHHGSCAIQVLDGQPAEASAATRPPAGVALPYPEGCAAYGLSPRRCAYIVDRALAEAGMTGRVARIELLGDPACDDKPADCVVMRTIAFIVRVRVTPGGGPPSDHPVFCGVGDGGSLACSETPQIEVRSTVGFGYHDIPCSGEGGNGGCASPVPSIDPVAARSAVALEVPSVPIPIDHEGAYVVDVGDAILPNGILTQATATLANNTRSDLLIPDGIRLEVVGEDGVPLENVYAHGWRPGTERVRVRFVFTVESFDPGSTLILTDVVVR